MLEFVVFHGGGYIVCICRILGVEHVGAKVEDGLLILALLIVFPNLPLRECLNEGRDSVDEACVFDRLCESFFGQVREADEQVNEG